MNTLIQKLKDVLNAKESGTIFFKTDADHAGIVSYQNGVLVGAVTGRFYGAEALEFIATAERPSYRIQERIMQLPPDSQPTADDVKRILSLMDVVLAPSAETGSAIDPELESQAFAIIAKQLTEFAGPIAAMLVDEVKESFVAATASPEAFERVLQILGQEIGDGEELQQFLHRTRTELVAIM